jgi:hypothetical protein
MAAYFSLRGEQDSEIARLLKVRVIEQHHFLASWSIGSTSDAINLIT